MLSKPPVKRERFLGLTFPVEEGKGSEHITETLPLYSRLTTLTISPVSSNRSLAVRLKRSLEYTDDRRSRVQLRLR
jgi:hypothetical protein